MPTIAHADEVVPDCSADPPCLALYERAKAASNQGDLDEALRLYKLAHEVRPDPLLLFSIARILHKQGNLSEAVPYYRRFLAAPTEDPVPRRKAEEYLQQIAAASTSQQPVASASPPTPQPKTESTPAYKKWWVWTLVGVGVAGGVATGIILGVSAANRGSAIPEGTPTITWTF